jgi:multiple sugar transport system ATP-binding protein
MPLEHLAQGLDWRVCVSDALLAAAEQDSPDEDAVARLQQRLGTTTVYVTHDQTEAMTLGDRVAVMRSGRLQQVGTPAELYNRPVNIFVAGFIGSPAMNFMPGELRDGVAETPLGEIHLHEQARARAGSHRGSVIVGVRPESFQDAHW